MNKMFNNAASALSPENKVLLYCARIEIEKKLTGKIRNILEYPIDWNYLVNTATSHGVAPLLYKNLKRMGVEDTVPEEAMKSLEAIYYATAVRNKRLFKEINKVLNALNNAGIKAMILKGPSLSEIIYKNPALRHFSDIDLLILKDDIPKVIDILEDMGYRLPEYLLPLELYAKFHFHLSFIKKNSEQSILEIHWDLKDNFECPPMELEKIWSDARQVEISGAPAMIMGTEDLIIYLCHHLDRHGYMNRFIYHQQDYHSFVLNGLSCNRLIWFVDIYEVVKFYGNSINWKYIIETSGKWDKNGSIASTLFFTDWLFQAELDSGILSALKPPRASTIECLSYKFIISRYYQKGQEDYILKFLDKNVLKMNERFQFRPIRLICLNHRILIRYILFPLQLVYYIFRRFISRRIDD